MFEARSLLFRIGFQIVFLLSHVLALYLFLRGHNRPGGGFVGGLVCALAFVVLSFDVGVARAKALLRVDPMLLACAGLALALLTAAAGPVLGEEFLRHYNGHVDIPLVGDVHLGTPLVFDAGVFLVVVGVFTKTVFALSEAAAGRDPLRGSDPRRYLANREDGHGPG